MNKESVNLSTILIRDGKYYLCIINKKYSRSIIDAPAAVSDDVYKKMEYKYICEAYKTLPHVGFSRKAIEEYAPSDEDLRIYHEGPLKKGDDLSLDDCHKLIDYYKSIIAKNDGWNVFGFDFSPTEEYQDIGEFYRDIQDQGYIISFRDIDSSLIDRMVSKGMIYLFQIYCKDFSERAKGKPNLFTLYWNAVFSEENLKNVVYKLNGGAEMFFRKRSIDPANAVVHPANNPVKNKNPLNPKKSSTYSYDIIKDRRYTVDKFFLHIPLVMNYKACSEIPFNLSAREAIKRNDNLHVIGIDRGENNLLYVCVIDSEGRIIEQKSLNVIEAGGLRTDYLALLKEREKARDFERKNWQRIDDIKNLKSGYLSHAISEITKLMIKYNAIVVLEDMSYGFKSSRQKIERNVYQQFEKKLISKLNYLVDKNIDEGENGGLFKAYQLSGPFVSFEKLGKQSGVLFYADSWNTKKIDPVTGFVNLFYIKYKSVKDSAAFWGKFDNISYDLSEDMFRFDFRYSDFTGKY